jgi:hypothetical protein
MTFDRLYPRGDSRGEQFDDTGFDNRGDGQALPGACLAAVWSSVPQERADRIMRPSGDDSELLFVG